MPSFNLAIVAGNLGRDPETRFSQDGKAICNFSLAVSDRGDRDKTTWLNIVLFGKSAETAQTYLKKGSSCQVQGRIQIREWQDKDGNKRTSTEIVGDRLVLMGGRDDAEQGQSPTRQQSPSRQPEYAPADDFSDDIPF